MGISFFIYAQGIKQALGVFIPAYLSFVNYTSYWKMFLQILILIRLRKSMKFCCRFTWSSKKLHKTDIHLNEISSTNFILDLQYQIQYDEGVIKIKLQMSQVCSANITFWCMCLGELQRCKKLSSCSDYFKPFLYNIHLADVSSFVRLIRRQLKTRYIRYCHSIHLN
jgi:hypothetical protein